MAELKPSKLLSELIAHAKRIGTRPNPPFTAERFFLAILERMNGDVPPTTSLEIGAEQIVLFGAFKDMVKNLAAAKRVLMDYICQEKNTSFLDDL